MQQRLQEELRQWPRIALLGEEMWSTELRSVCAGAQNDAPRGALGSVGRYRQLRRGILLLPSAGIHRNGAVTAGTVYAPRATSVSAPCTAGVPG